MGLWRIESPVFNDAGDTILKGGMFPHQRNWWESTSFIKALVTGYGGGKTFTAAKRSIALALHNAPRINSGELCPHITVSPSYKVAKRTIIPALRALLMGKSTLLPGFRYNQSKVDNSFTIWYKGREGVIWIGSGDDPESLKGPNVGSALVDEPFIQDKEVLNQMLARVRSPIARHLEIGLTGTPEELNWGYDICEGEEKDNYNVSVVHASTRANLALSPDYADRMERAFTERAAEAYIEGEFKLLTEGLVYYGFGDKNIQDLDDPGLPLGVGMDFNVNPMSGIIFWVHGNHMHIMDEIMLPNSDTQYMCQHIVDTYKTPAGECRASIVYPDSSGSNRSTKSPGGKSDFHYIRDAGFEIDAPTSNPGIRDRENAVNGKFSPKDKSEPTLTVSPKCKKLISYLRKYQHEKKHKQKEMSHLIDATGYPVHRLFPIVKPEVILARIHGA